MELFLLLLVIFLQLRGGRRGRGHSQGQRAADPEPPQPGGGSCRREWGAFLGQWDPGPGRETSAERGSVSAEGRGAASSCTAQPALPLGGSPE